MAEQGDYRRAEEVVREMIKHGVTEINLSQEEIIWLAHKTKTWDYRKWKDLEIPEFTGKVYS